MSATVRAGEKGVDFSFARPPAARLKELGYTFVVGYISVPPASPAKNVSKEECEAYVAAGIKVLLVWEMSATSPNQGAPAGETHGRNAKILAAARGYPTDVPILVADDTNTTPTNIEAHEAYVRAFAAACAPYPIGIYGDTDILDRCSGLWQIGWLPNAWSWSGASRAQAEAKAKALGAHVLQRKGFYIDNVWAVDPNDAIADFPAWGSQVAPPPPPPTIGDDMPAFISNKQAGKYGAAPSPQGGCTIWELVRNRKSALSFEAWIGYGQPYGVALDDAVIDGIPDHTEGGGTVDEIARADAMAALSALTRVGSTISDIRMGAQRIADAGG